MKITVNITNEWDASEALRSIADSLDNQEDEQGRIEAIQNDGFMAEIDYEDEDLT